MKVICFYRFGVLKTMHISAITLYPFVLFADPKLIVSQSLFRHELEHIYQVQRMGWIRFYTSYITCYLRSRWQGKGHFQAYFSNPFEIEARNCEKLSLTEAEQRIFYT